MSVSEVSVRCLGTTMQSTDIMHARSYFTNSDSQPQGSISVVLCRTFFDSLGCRGTTHVEKKVGKKIQRRFRSFDGRDRRILGDIAKTSESDLPLKLGLLCCHDRHLPRVPRRHLPERKKAPGKSCVSEMFS